MTPPAADVPLAMSSERPGNWGQCLSSAALAPRHPTMLYLQLELLEVFGPRSYSRVGMFHYLRAVSHAACGCDNNDSLSLCPRVAWTSTSPLLTTTFGECITWELIAVAPLAMKIKVVTYPGWFRNLVPAMHHQQGNQRDPRRESDISRGDVEVRRLCFDVEFSSGLSEFVGLCRGRDLWQVLFLSFQESAVWNCEEGV